eukprot:7311960-Alexandrium_andersonii.AAC.1
MPQTKQPVSDYAADVSVLVCLACAHICVARAPLRLRCAWGGARSYASKRKATQVGKVLNRTRFKTKDAVGEA